MSAAIATDHEEVMERHYRAVMRGDSFKELFREEFKLLRAAIEARDFEEVEECIASLERSACNACEGI